MSQHPAVGPSPRKRYRVFASARIFAHTLGLTTKAQWLSWCRGALENLPKKPSDIPRSPRKIYGAEWTNWGDWLGRPKTWRNITPRRNVWRDFTSARAFARSLRIKSGEDWLAWAQGRRANLPPRPPDIPASPSAVYAGDWVNWADWLGIEASALPKGRTFRDFQTAREFVRALKLRSFREWTAWLRKERADLPERPIDIPAVPWVKYRGLWVDWADWLGISRLSARGRAGRRAPVYAQFAEAREWTRQLGLRTCVEWAKFRAGRRPDLPQRPANIPGNPSKVYGDSWRGWADFLGTSQKTNLWRNYALARVFVHELGLNSKARWKLWCDGALENLPQKPPDIPVNPERIYGNEWIGWYDWLGRNHWRSFDSARAFVHDLGLGTFGQWQEWCAGRRLDLLPRPDDIPASPHKSYGAEWTGWSNWLGRPANWHRKSRPVGRVWRDFASARAFVHQLNLRTDKDWRTWKSGGRPDLPPRPNDIPAAPSSAYKAQWIGWGDWLGRPANWRRKNWRTFFSARTFIHGLGLSTYAQWRAWCAGKRLDLVPRPEDIPAAPQKIFAEEWTGWADWLGVPRSHPGGRTGRKPGAYVTFIEARKWACQFDLRTKKEWVGLCRGQRPDLPQRPITIPASPWSVYAESWQGWADFLGNSSKNVHNRVI